jgi:hypothetical protein
MVDPPVLTTILEVMANVPRYPLNAEEMAREHRKDGLSLRKLLRDKPDLTPGHVHRTHYAITESDEKRIVGDPGFAGVDRRATR